MGIAIKLKSKKRENLEELRVRLEDVRMSQLVGTSRHIKEGTIGGGEEALEDTFDQELANLDSVDVELGGEDLFGQSGELFGLEEAELIPRR